MTIGQYRSLVAYMNFWTPLYPDTMGLDQGIKDVGITDDKETVIFELWKAGWNFQPDTGRIVYTDDEVHQQ